MRKKPIELMHRYFDEMPGFYICAECRNFLYIRAGGKMLKKCRAYGGLHSSKADWAKKWPACGLFDKEVDGQMVSDTAKAMFQKIGVGYEEPISGQCKLKLPED